MNLVRKIIKKIVKALRGKPLTEGQLNTLLINKIRIGGGVVGDNVDILSSSIDLLNPYLITIGDNVTLTTMRLLTHDASTKKSLGYTKVGRVTIGSDVFVGAGSIILPGTTIGSKVIIGSGSIVASDIPDNSVACGSPCRVICSYDDYINRMKIKMTKYPTFDLLPDELLKDEFIEERKQLIEAGYGFMK